MLECVQVARVVAWFNIVLDNQPLVYQFSPRLNSGHHRDILSLLHYHPSLLAHSLWPTVMCKWGTLLSPLASTQHVIYQRVMIFHRMTVRCGASLLHWYVKSPCEVHIYIINVKHITYSFSINQSISLEHPQCQVLKDVPCFSVVSSSSVVSTYDLAYDAFAEFHIDSFYLQMPPHIIAFFETFNICRGQHHAAPNLVPMSSTFQSNRTNEAWTTLGVTPLCSHST